MALNAHKLADDNKAKQPNIDVGNYPARVVQVIDLGVQNQRAFQGKEKPPAHFLRVVYELVDEFCVDEDGNEMEDKPRWLDEEFPLYPPFADKAKCNKRYDALDPDGLHDYNWGMLIGNPCVVTVVRGQGKGKNAGKEYDNVGNITPYVVNKRNPELPQLQNDSKLFDMDEPDMEVFKSLPQWIQDKITGGLEFRGSALDNALHGAAPAAKPKKEKDVPQVNAQPDDHPFDEDEEW